MNIVEYAKFKKMFGSGGGASGGGNERDLGYWFFTKLDQIESYTSYEDPETGDMLEDVVTLGIKDSITVPRQVQDGSATSFENLFADFYYDEMAWQTYETGVWAKEICGVINCANVTSLDSLFYMCEETEEICPIINTENVTDFSNMFLSCGKLTNIPPIDIRNATKVGSMFGSCYALESVILKNIKVSIDVRYSTNLTVDSLVGLCYELINTGSTKTLTIGNTNLNKLANVYVKSIPITDAMRAEDDLIDDKMPFVRCESTDSGATKITDYIKAKNWALK